MNNIYDDEVFSKEYAKMARSQQGLAGAGEWHQLKPLFPNLLGKKVLDLGCGYGWHCKHAVDLGAAEVLGIDLSEKMIEAANEKNRDTRITYQVCGLDGFSYPPAAYDFVVSNLVLHYVADLNGVYQNVYKTLKPNGVFLFNIEHPVFTGSVNQDWVYDDEGNPLYWPIDNYFYTGARKTRFLGLDVEKEHHTLTQILGGLLQNGFSIEAVEEAMPDDSMMALPGMQYEMKRPMMLLVKAVKKD